MQLGTKGALLEVLPACGYINDTCVSSTEYFNQTNYHACYGRVVYQRG
jgi:hypothetical protein